jgi:NTE family protein
MRALVLSGGGGKGAYQAGALRHLIMDLGRQYDILCGVSVGALNCSFLSMFNKDNEKEGFEKLLQFWLTTNNSKVWKRWFPFGKLHALWLKSMYNSQPLIDTVHKYVDLNAIRKSGRKVCVGAVSLTTGEYRSFTQDDDSFVDGVLASSAFPSGLKPIFIEGQLYTDGGVKHVTPLKEAIDLGATEIDVILCSPFMTTASYDNSSTTIKLAMRTIDLMSDEIIDADLKIAKLYNKISLIDSESGKKFITMNIIRPKANLIEDSLQFDPEQIKIMIDKGYADAKDMKL